MTEAVSIREFTRTLDNDCLVSYGCNTHNARQRAWRIFFTSEPPRYYRAKCDTSNCCLPSHLETSSETCRNGHPKFPSNRRGVGTRYQCLACRSHCPRGHKLTERNGLWIESLQTFRCRMCIAAAKITDCGHDLYAKGALVDTKPHLVKPKYECRICYTNRKCSAGLHRMTADNTLEIANGRKRCLKCHEARFTGKCSEGHPLEIIGGVKRCRKCEARRQRKYRRSGLKQRQRLAARAALSPEELRRLLDTEARIARYRRSKRSDKDREVTTERQRLWRFFKQVEQDEAEAASRATAVEHESA